MPLHIADYLADTGHLTASEHGAYLLLIMHYWQNGHLPENERLIARIAKMDAVQWGESREILMMLFGDGWRHKRIDAELAKADGIIGKRKAAADARHAKSKADASAVHVQNKSTDTGALPLTKIPDEKEEPNGSSKKRGSRIPDDFVPDLAWAEGEGLSASQAKIEAAKFRDYWTAKSGAAATKLDWPATWRLWVRNVRPGMALPRAGPMEPAKPSLSGGFRDLGEQMRREREVRSGESGSGVRALVPDLSRLSDGRH